MNLLEKVTVPEGKSGPWQVERFTISEKEAKFENMRACFSFTTRGSYIKAGNYTRLTYGATVVMTDTPDEMKDLYQPVRYAKGNILINGLGLGVVLLACLKKPEVAHATVIELDQDVINLVGPHYLEMFPSQLTIIEADAFTWKPPKNKKYDMVWHDIWTYKCGDNYKEMKRLHRRYGKRAEWQGSWCKESARIAYQRDQFTI